MTEKERLEQRRSNFVKNCKWCGTEFKPKRKTKEYCSDKLTFDYNASKLVDPYSAGEIFYRLDGKYEFRVWRFIGGLTWRINKKLDLKTYYQFEQEFNTKSNDRFHVFGVDLAWTIN